MIEEGLLETYPFDAIIAQHVYPEMEAGKVGFKAGMYMASADEIYLTIHGKRRPRCICLIKTLTLLLLHPV